MTTRHMHRSSPRVRRGARAAVVGAILLGSAGAAGAVGAQTADDPYVGGSTTVANTQVEDPAVAANTSASDPAASASDLAFTGGDAMVIALVGGALLAGGFGLLALRRRQLTAA